jgi:hypothetical protein
LTKTVLGAGATVFANLANAVKITNGARGISFAVRVVAIHRPIAIVIKPVAAGYRDDLEIRRCSAVNRAGTAVLVRVADSIPTDGRWPAIHLTIDTILGSLAHEVTTARGNAEIGAAGQAVVDTPWVVASNRIHTVTGTAAEPSTRCTCLKAVAVRSA